MFTGDWSRNPWGRAGTLTLRAVSCYQGEESRAKMDLCHNGPQR